MMIFSILWVFCILAKESLGPKFTDCRSTLEAQNMALKKTKQKQPNLKKKKKREREREREREKRERKKGKKRKKEGKKEKIRKSFGNIFDGEKFLEKCPVHKGLDHTLQGRLHQEACRRLE